MSVESVINRTILGFLTVFDVQYKSSPLVLRIEPYNVKLHDFFYHIYIVKYYPISQNVKQAFFRIEYHKGEKKYTTLRSPLQAEVTILDAYNPGCEKIQIQVQPDGIVDMLVELLMAHSQKYGWHPTVAGMGLKCAILKDEKESFILEPINTLTGIASLIFSSTVNLSDAFASELRRRINIIKFTTAIAA